MDRKEIGYEDVDFIHVARNRAQCRALVNEIMKLRYIQKVWKLLTSWTTTSFSRWTARCS